MKKTILLLSFVFILGMTSIATCPDSLVKDKTPTTLYDVEGNYPLELIAFNVTRFGNSNMLNWATDYELNSSYFSVERSYDGYNYDNISYVEGNGTVSSISNYEYLDFETKSVYYRLKQVDYDGNYEYSDIVKVTLDNDPELILTTIITTKGQVININNNPLELASYSGVGKVIIVKQYLNHPTTKEVNSLD
jgi:hypothetical protein